MKTFCLSVVVFLLAGSIDTRVAFAQAPKAGWAMADIPPDVNGKAPPEAALVFGTVLSNISYAAGEQGSFSVGRLDVKADNSVQLLNLPGLPVNLSIGVMGSASQQCRVAVCDDSGSVIACARLAENRSDKKRPNLAKLSPDSRVSPLPLGPGKYRVEYRVLGKTFAAIPFEISEMAIDGKTYLVVQGEWSKWAFLNIVSHDRTVDFGVWLNHVGTSSATITLNVLHNGKLVANGTTYPSYPIWKRDMITLQHDTKSTGKRGSVTGKDLAEWSGDLSFTLSRQIDQGPSVVERKFNLKVVDGKPSGLDLAKTTGYPLVANPGEYWMQATE